MLCRYGHSTDNAAGLFHTTGESLPRRAAKYRPLVPVLREMILRTDTPLDGEVKDMIAGQLDKAGTRLAAITGDQAGAYGGLLPGPASGGRS